MNGLYRPSQSALDSTILQFSKSQQQKVQFLEHSLKKQGRILNDNRFQQSHVKAAMQQLNEKHQADRKKYTKKQEQLTEQLQLSSQFVTIQQLKYALMSNNWSEQVGYFLNPLAAFQSMIAQLPNNESVIEQSQFQQQVLLKHFEQKLIVLQKVISTDDRITQFKEQIKMISEDIDGRNEQLGALLIEYEELQEVLEKWKSQHGSNVEPISKMLQIRTQLGELKTHYMGLANTRMEKEKQLKQITLQVNELQQALNSQRSNGLQITSSSIDTEIHHSIKFWFQPDSVYQLLLKLLNHSDDINKIQFTYNLIQQIHIKVTSCCYCLLQKQIPFEQRQRQFDQNYWELGTLLRENNMDIQLDSSVFECLLCFKHPMDVLNRLQQQSVQFREVLQHQVNLYQNTQEHTDLKYLVLNLKIERTVHKLLYDQSMIQCNYQRLESQLLQLRLAGPILIMNTQTYQLEHLLDRLNTIENLKRKNQQISEITLPQEMAQIKQQINMYQGVLQQQVNDLFYQAQLEQQQYQILLQTYCNDIPQKTIPKLVLQKSNDDVEYLTIELEQNKRTSHQQEDLYTKQLQLMQSKLKGLQVEENALQDSIDTTNKALRDYKEQQSEVSAYDINTDSFLNDTKYTTRKENIPPLQSRKNSIASQDQSILGTIHIDMSQERTTPQLTRRKENNNNTKQLMKNRSRSQIQSHGDVQQQQHRSSQSITNQHFVAFQSPTQSVRKTKLTLIPQQSIRTNLSSQMSAKNPMLSPQSILGGHSSSQKLLEIDQSLSMHSSARKFNEDSSRFSSGMNQLFNTRTDPQHRSSSNTMSEQKVFKVYRRVISTRIVKSIPMQSPPRPNNNNNAYQGLCQQYIPKNITINHKLKTIDVYPSNKPVHDLKSRECQWIIKHLQSISDIYEVKGVVKSNFTFSGITIVQSKQLKIELLFAKKDELMEFLKLISSY